MPESKKTSSQNLLPTLKSFSARHIGITDIESREMLEQLGYSSYKEFIEQVVPKDILNTQPLNLEEGISEEIALKQLKVCEAFLPYITHPTTERIIPFKTNEDEINQDEKRRKE